MLYVPRAFDVHLITEEWYAQIDAQVRLAHEVTQVEYRISRHVQQPLYAGKGVVIIVVHDDDIDGLASHVDTGEESIDIATNPIRVLQQRGRLFGANVNTFQLRHVALQIDTEQLFQQELLVAPVYDGTT